MRCCCCYLHAYIIIRRDDVDGIIYHHYRLGVGAHKDYGFLAVLAQDDVGGLEVRMMMVAVVLLLVIIIMRL